MIAVQGFEGRKVAVLGLGRSGMATARALVAGGAVPVLWDDSPEARAAAEADGFATTDLTRAAAFEGMAALIVSPGIPAPLSPAEPRGRPCAGGGRAGGQ